LEWELPAGIAKHKPTITMSTKIITENGRSRLSFACDKCGRSIEPGEGTVLWDSESEKSSKDGSHDGIIACHKCAPSFKKELTQPLEQALIFLLAKTGWLDATFRPSNKLKEAAKVTYRLAQF
jgi:hypothetical protein